MDTGKEFLCKVEIMGKKIAAKKPSYRFPDSWDEIVAESFNLRVRYRPSEKTLKKFA